jgi:hypothetical protein
MLLVFLRVIRRAIVVLGVIGFLFGILLEAIPVYTNGTNEVINAIHITNQQYALDERISKDVCALTQPGDHSQSVLELQVTLPAFEKNQADLQSNLQTNDPSFELPAHIPGDVQLLIIQSQSDYAALDSAARSILNNADPPIDQNQLAIIQQHERPYFITMGTAAKVWQGHIRDNAIMFFQFELGLDIAVLALMIAHWVLGKVIQMLERRNVHVAATTKTT